ncbi:MAG: hypothetical protein IPQ13_07200 [Holophagaceae bacterium]|nr:hypothetical protein [Holophagaceae bacterium]
MSISPPNATVVAGGGVEFVGSASDGATLDWEIAQPNGGSVTTWQYSNSVVYQSPALEGTFQLKATHPKDPNSTATASIQVKASGGVWGGVRGFPTFRDGYSDYWYTITGPTLTVLANGKCLIAGGSEFFGPALASADLLDLQTGDRLGRYQATGPMAQARRGHVATLLNDGRVLMTGGTSGSNILASTELFNPQTSTFTASGNMAIPRVGHQATLLKDGRVLITGGLSPGPWNGQSFNSPTAKVEVFDPSADGGRGQFQTLSALATARYWHSATALKDGRVLITGGVNGPNAPTDVFSGAEIWDFNAQASTASAPLAHSRARHNAVLLPSGKVLVAGGYIPSNTTTISGLTSAELFDPATNQFQPTGGMSNPRYAFGMVLLPNGMAMAVAGGRADGSAEIFDPALGTFHSGGFPGGTWQTQRTIGLLPDGRVVFSGMPYNTVISTVSVFYP